MSVCCTITCVLKKDSSLIRNYLNSSAKKSLSISVNHQSTCTGSQDARRQPSALFSAPLWPNGGTLLDDMHIFCFFSLSSSNKKIKFTNIEEVEYGISWVCIWHITLRGSGGRVPTSPPGLSTCPLPPLGGVGAQYAYILPPPSLLFQIKKLYF